MDKGRARDEKLVVVLWSWSPYDEVACSECMEKPA